jgi:hypothetical protein
MGPALGFLQATCAYSGSLTTSSQESGTGRDSPVLSRSRAQTRSVSAFSEELPMKKEVPQKKEVPHDKYFLKSLHQEIDLYDRKLAYLEKFAQFASTADREGAENKLLAKRATLAEKARLLVADGVEFNRTDLPRSFRALAEATADR